MFSNGKVKGVGLKCNEDIYLSFESLRKYLHNQLHLMHNTINVLPPSNDDIRTLITLHGTRATMYNTDFSSHFQIMREELLRVILDLYTFGAPVVARDTLDAHVRPFDIVTVTDGHVGFHVIPFKR